MGSADSRSALAHLFDAQRRRELILERSSATRNDNAEQDDDRECPIFDQFYDEDGNEGLLKLTNFTAVELRHLYAKIQAHVSACWNVGRGRKSTFKPMDVFFMSLAVLKHGGSWDVLAKVFEMKTPTFERLICGFIKAVSKELVELFVSPVSRAYSMECLQEHKTTFKNFPCAIEAIDVTFQQSNRPSGNMQEGKRYFSGKHKLYGYKMEVCVRPNGLASAFSQHYPGSVSDITIMSQRIEEHKFRTEKVSEDKELTDDEDEDSADEGTTQTHWAILADKGYQGAHEMMRCITPYKKPRQGDLTVHQERYNKKLSSDRIIVENFFGRMQSLWGIMGTKYRWSESLYDTIAAMCVALTNVHVDKLPLRSLDGDWLNRYLNNLSFIGNEKKRKRAEDQAMYRERRNNRLRIGFRSAVPDSM